LQFPLFEIVSLQNDISAIALKTLISEKTHTTLMLPQQEAILYTNQNLIYVTETNAAVNELCNFRLKHIFYACKVAKCIVQNRNDDDDGIKITEVHEGDNMRRINSGNACYY
jgi:hypothetical protein